jgi:hypothetical protein
MSARSERETGILGEAVFRAHADGEDDQPGFQRLAGFQLRRDAIRQAFEALDAIAEDQFHAFLTQGIFQRFGHFRIQLRQYLRLQLDHADVLADVVELLRHFQTDETRADDGDALDLGGGRLDAVHVLQVAQREDQAGCRCLAAAAAAGWHRARGPACHRRSRTRFRLLESGRGLVCWRGRWRWLR